MTARTMVAGTNAGNLAASWTPTGVPAATDDLTVPSGSTISCPAATTCLGRSMTIQSGGGITFAATTSVLTLGDATAGAGNVALSISSGATVTLTGIGTINFNSTSATQQTITTGGKTLPNINFGAAGNYIHSDAVTSTGALTTTLGTWNTGNFNLTLSSLNLGPTSGTRNISLGSSAISLSATGIAFQCLSTTGLTFNTTTAVITCTGNMINANSIILIAFNWQGLSFVLNGGGTPVINTGGGAIINNLTITGTANKLNTYWLTSTLTVSGLLTIAGQSAANALMVQSNTPGSSRTITCANAPVLSNVVFMDIVAAGAGGTWTGTRIGNGLGNSNITFDASRTLYGVGGNVFGDVTSSWALTSGGTPGANLPLPQDDIIFDNNTFTAINQRFQLNTPYTARNMTANVTAFTGCTVGTASGISIGFFGSVTYSNLCTDNGNASGQVTYYGRSSFTITSNGLRYGGPIIQAPGGTYALQDDYLTTSGNNKGFSHTYGTFDANGHNLRWQNYAFNATITLLKMGIGSNWIISRGASAAVWSNLAPASAIQTQTSTISYDTTVLNTGTHTFGGGSVAYYIADFRNNGSTATMLMQGNNYFDTIHLRDTVNARTLQYTAGSLTTVKNYDVVGTSGKLMTTNSSTGASPYYLAIVGAPANCDYLSVQDQFASEPYKFFAGSNSTSVSGNTNYNTGVAPATPYVKTTNDASTSGSSSTVAFTWGQSAIAGELLELEFFWATSPGTVTPPSGFLQEQPIVSATGGAFSQRFYKVAVGGETSFTTTTTASPGIVAVKAILGGGFIGTPTLDVVDTNNSGVTPVTTLPTTAGSGVTNTGTPALAIASWASNGIVNSTSFTNNFEETRQLTNSASLRTAVLPLTTLAATSSTFTWTSAHVASAQMAIFKDVISSSNTGHFFAVMGI